MVQGGCVWLVGERVPKRMVEEDSQEGCQEDSQGGWCLVEEGSQEDCR